MLFDCICIESLSSFEYNTLMIVSHKFIRDIPFICEHTSTDEIHASYRKYNLLLEFVGIDVHV